MKKEKPTSKLKHLELMIKYPTAKAYAENVENNELGPETKAEHQFQKDLVKGYEEFSKTDKRGIWVFVTGISLYRRDLWNRYNDLILEHNKSRS